LPSDVINQLIQCKADINCKTKEGTLVAELLFRQDVSEAEKLQNSIKCFKNTGLKLVMSKENQEFHDSKEFK